MRLRRTSAELKQFNKIAKEYMADGYPKWYADQQAWDLLLLERRLKKDKVAA